MPLIALQCLIALILSSPRFVLKTRDEVAVYQAAAAVQTVALALAVAAALKGGRLVQVAVAVNSAVATSIGPGTAAALPLVVAATEP